MKRLSTLLPLLLALAAIGSPIAAPSDSADGALSKRASSISTSLYNDLVFYYQYASSAYPAACAKPNGNTLVTRIDNPFYDTQGFIARDDTRKEIVVVFRGSTSATDFLLDSNLYLTAFLSPGVKAPVGTLVHTGFLTAYNAVASSVISTVRSQLAAYPGYTIVTSGHSLGGSLSSLAGISLKQNFPNSKLRLYTYGQPRIGNAYYASFVNQQVGVGNIFRAVHTSDGAPTLLPVTLGYQHHATEYWTYSDPSSAATTKQCNSSGEDPTCSGFLPSGGLNTQHLYYYGIGAGSSFCT